MRLGDSLCSQIGEETMSTVQMETNNEASARTTHSSCDFDSPHYWFEKRCAKSGLARGDGRVRIIDKDGIL